MSILRKFTNALGLTFDENKTDVIFAEDMNDVGDALDNHEERIADIEDDSIPNMVSWGGNANSSKKLIGSNDNQDIGIKTNNSEVITIKNSGNVGINSSAPANKLSVGGGLSVGNSYKEIATAANGLIVEGNSSFGNSAPVARLHVTSPSYPVMQIERKANLVALRYWGAELYANDTGTSEDGQGIAFLFSVNNSAGTKRTASIFGGGLLSVTPGSEKGAIFFCPSYAGQDSAARTDMYIVATGSTSGQSILYIESSVGILTNAPTAKLDINSDILRLRTAKTPASASASGNVGDICWDSSYIYICVASNTWKRVAISTW